MANENQTLTVVIKEEGTPPPGAPPVISSSVTRPQPPPSSEGPKIPLVVPLITPPPVVPLITPPPPSESRQLPPTTISSSIVAPPSSNPPVSPGEGTKLPSITPSTVVPPEESSTTPRTSLSLIPPSKADLTLEAPSEKNLTLKAPPKEDLVLSLPPPPGTDLAVIPKSRGTKLSVPPPRTQAQRPTGGGKGGGGLVPPKGNPPVTPAPAGGFGGVLAGLIRFGPQLAMVGVAVGVAVVALKQLADTIKAVDAMLENLTETGASFSAEISAAQARREISEIIARFRQAKELEDTIPYWVESKTQVDSAMINLETAVTKVVGPVMEALNEKFIKLLEVIEAFFELIDPAEWKALWDNYGSHILTALVPLADVVDLLHMILVGKKEYETDTDSITDQISRFISTSTLPTGVKDDLFTGHSNIKNKPNRGTFR